MNEPCEREKRFRVVLAESASLEAQQIYDYIAEDAADGAAEWLEDCIESLRSLERFPYRNALAREARRTKLATRCLLFGKGRNVYRALYEIHEADAVVSVVHIRHGSRRDIELGPEDRTI